MNPQALSFLQAERETLESLLKQLPESSVIERQGLEFRKKNVEEALASQEARDRQPDLLRLTFCGKPIAGSHGIFADFGAAAVGAFTDAVAAIGASRHTSIGSRGRLPNRENYRLLITDTALGSFGFELQEAPHDRAFGEPRRLELFQEVSPVESAVDLTMSILEATVDTDERLTEAIADTHPRALNSLRTFLKQVADHRAVCALEFKDHVFRFADVGQVRHSETLLSQDHMFEEELNISGRFRGALLSRREFEFLSRENGEVISGKLDSSIKDADAINRILDRPTRIRSMRGVWVAPASVMSFFPMKKPAVRRKPDMHSAGDQSRHATSDAAWHGPASSTVATHRLCRHRLHSLPRASRFNRHCLSNLLRPKDSTAPRDVETGGSSTWVMTASSLPLRLLTNPQHRRGYFGDREIPETLLRICQRLSLERPRRTDSAHACCGTGQTYPALATTR